MDIFLNLVTNLIPLYILIGLGFFAGRYLNVDKQTLANMVLYICMPVMVFGFVATLDMKPAYVFLPIIAFTIHVIVGLTMLYVGRKIYGDARANLLSMCAAMGNSGYFGLPLVLLLFEEKWVGVYMFMLLGFVLYEGTFGYYIAARGKFTMRDSIRKLVRFPSIYAVCAGLLVNFIHLPLPDLFTTYWIYFKGAYVIIGMMLIGAALSGLKTFVFSPRFAGLVFLGKFALWPLLAFTFITLDRLYLNLFEEEVRKLIFVVSLVPPAANVAAFAAQFDIRPEKAATTILAGTIFALVFIPAMLVLVGM